MPTAQTYVQPFVDVGTNMDPSDPLYPDQYVAILAAYGITQGCVPEQHLFEPYNNVSRAQLITMIVRSANLTEPPSSYAPPFGVFAATHYPFARKAAYAGLLDGLQGMGPDYEFLCPATRGKVSAMLFNLLNR